MSNIETKVLTAASGAGLGSAVGSFLLWLLGVLVWHQSASAESAAAAIGAVPSPVSLLVLAVLAVLGSFISGYLAPHTKRPDLEPTPPTA